MTPRRFDGELVVVLSGELSHYWHFEWRLGKNRRPYTQVHKYIPPTEVFNYFLTVNETRYTLSKNHRSKWRHSATDHRSNSQHRDVYSKYGWANRAFLLCSVEYLIEYSSTRRLGKIVSKSIYIRMPNCKYQCMQMM